MVGVPIDNPWFAIFDPILEDEKSADDDNMSRRFAEEQNFKRHTKLNAVLGDRTFRRKSVGTLADQTTIIDEVSSLADDCYPDENFFRVSQTEDLDHPRPLSEHRRVLGVQSESLPENERGRRRERGIKKASAPHGSGVVRLLSAPNMAALLSRRNSEDENHAKAWERAIGLDLAVNTPRYRLATRYERNKRSQLVRVRARPSDSPTGISLESHSLASVLALEVCSHH